MGFTNLHSVGTLPCDSHINLRQVVTRVRPKIASKTQPQHWFQINYRAEDYNQITVIKAIYSLKFNTNSRYIFEWM